MLKRNVYTPEDEYHFLMVCPDYDSIRLDFFPSNMVENVRLNKFYSFMNSKKKKKKKGARYYLTC